MLNIKYMLIGADLKNVSVARNVILFQTFELKMERIANTFQLQVGQKYWIVINN